MRIDAHVHYAPATLLGHLTEREPYWELLLGSSPDPGPDPSRIIEDMDAAGLDRVVLMGNYWRTHEMCVANNTALLDVLRRRPDRFIAFASLQPIAGQAALDELKRCLDGGMTGVGELGPYGQGFGLHDPGFLQLAEECIEHDIPLNLHVNEPIGHYYPGKTSTPLLDYYSLAQRYPELKLILAHWGGGLPFYEMMPEVRRVLRNTFYDTAASPLLYRTAEIFPSVLRWLDPGKVLYGSDYPLPICGKKQRGPDFRPFIGEIDELALDPAIRTAVMGGNAARLLRLGASNAEVPREPAQLPEGSPAPPQARQAGRPLADLRLSAAAIAGAWPETQKVFELYQIDWQDRPAPDWEPLEQAAAAKGLGPDQRTRLLQELNACIPPPHSG